MPRLRGSHQDAVPSGIGDGPLRSTDREKSPGFLFFGRIMAYKGLPLFVQACEQLRAKGLRFRIGVVGEGALDELAPRLADLDAEVVNRWVDLQELPAIFSRYDATVVPSIEASQSGVVAAAHGFGLPVIATPVGGLIEQVADGRTGLLADAVSAEALARAMERWLSRCRLAHAAAFGCDGSAADALHASLL